jgi:methionyl-tRNA synthetase
MRKILVTAALPYANGPIHIGHLVEYVQTDIWVRFQRLRGHRCIFMWADDTHGSAIMKSARKAGITEEAFVDQMSAAHQRDFRAFGISYDYYGSTHSQTNRQIATEIWEAFESRGMIARRPVTELFDPDTGESLPDRFVQGTCPKCKSPNQHGDNCEKCTATYSATDLIDPISTVSGKPPVVGETDHFFVQIDKLQEFLTEWTQSGKHLQDEVANYLKGHFLNEPLRDWDVSRPAPYFGFDIPGTDGKHFWYVWFDAPIGYIAATREWCEQTGEDFGSWWRSDETEIHHFLGKDIQYFHCLFWPAMLKTAGFTLPTRIHIHGFLTVGGEKMSKSKGTFIMAETYLRHLHPAFLRYYYASKLGPRLDDLDMNLDDFVARVNADLVGKVVNLASRTAKFVEHCGLSASYPDDGGLFAHGAQLGRQIAEAYENCDYSRAMRLIIELADRANPFVENAAPWTLKKDPAAADRLQDVCTIALNLFRQIVVYLSPVLPDLAEQVGALLNDPIRHWDQSQTPLSGTAVNKFEHLMKRIDEKDVQKMVDESKQSGSVAGDSVTASPWKDSGQPLLDEPLSDQCTIEDFVKVDLRVARVIAAEEVAEARKLLKLTLSLGGDQQRTVFAGIKAAYDPARLVGRLVIMVANLKPRQMKFGLSEGMVCAAGPGGEDVFILAVDEGAQPGQRVH